VFLAPKQKIGSWQNFEAWKLESIVYGYTILWYFMLNIMQECQIQLSATLSASHNEENHSCLSKDKSKNKQDAQKILRNPSAQNSWENSSENCFPNPTAKKFLRKLLLWIPSTQKLLRQLLHWDLSAKNSCENYHIKISVLKNSWENYCFGKQMWAPKLNIEKTDYWLLWAIQVGSNVILEKIIDCLGNPCGLKCNSWENYQWLWKIQVGSNSILEIIIDYFGQSKWAQIVILEEIMDCFGKSK
jgi:hypothetical protein